MRRSVCENACFHCARVSPSTKPEMIAATNTPVPTADTQLSVNCAPSGLAFGAATGGMRCTRLCSPGMSHLGADSVPVNFEPNSVVSNLTVPNRSLSQAFLSPHTRQGAIRIAHGSQAWMVSPSLYLYFHSAGTSVALAPASRSERSRKRCLGCQIQRRNAAVHATENTPDTTSVVRWKPSLLDDRYCMIAKLPPEPRVAGPNPNACFPGPPPLFTHTTTNPQTTPH